MRRAVASLRAERWSCSTRRRPAEQRAKVRTIAKGAPHAATSTLRVERTPSPWQWQQGCDALAGLGEVAMPQTLLARSAMRPF